MINFIKDNVASYVVDRQLSQNTQGSVSFTKFFSSSYSFFIVMPEDEKDYLHSFDFLHFLDKHNKNCVLFTYEYKVSLLPIKFRGNVFVRNPSDISRWNLPTKNMQTKLNELRFDISIDLNRVDNLYCSFVANLVKAHVKVGYVKQASDKFYNLQIENVQEDAELSYKNLVNCLEMF